MVLVRSVEVLGAFRVRLEFDSGEVKEVDLEPLLRGAVFEPLRRDVRRFREVRVDPELGTIVWDNGADLDPDVLYGSHQPAWADVDTTAARR